MGCPSEAIQILIADDEDHIRSALRLLLDHQPGMCIVGDVATSERRLAEVRLRQPHVLLVDWDMIGLDPQLLLNLRAGPPVIILAMSGRPEARIGSRALGVDGFVSKAEPPEGLLRALRAACPPRPTSLPEPGHLTR